MNFKDFSLFLNFKPNNILVKLSRNNEVECLTLSDFGSSALYHYWTPQPPTEFITFVAPECFDKSPELINFFFVDSKTNLLLHFLFIHLFFFHSLVLWNHTF